MINADHVVAQKLEFVRVCMADVDRNSRRRSSREACKNIFKFSRNSWERTFSVDLWINPSPSVKVKLC